MKKKKSEETHYNNMHQIINCKIWLITIYALLFTILSVLINLPSNKLLGEIIHITLYGGKEIKDANIIYFISYYCIKLGILFLAYSMIADEGKELGRYIFIRMKNRSKWLYSRYLSLGWYALYYWLVIYFVYSSTSVLLGLRECLLPIDQGLISMFMNWTSILVFLFLANFLSQYFDERIALLISIISYLSSDLFVNYTGDTTFLNTFFFPTAWGRYSVIEEISRGAYNSSQIALYAICLNIFAIILITSANAKILKSSDVY